MPTTSRATARGPSSVGVLPNMMTMNTSTKVPMNSVTTFQNGLLGAPGSFCTKSNAPGPSEVPAAKELPIAAGQVEAREPLARVNVKFEKSTKVWKDRTAPERVVKFAESYMFFAPRNWRLPIS